MKDKFIQKFEAFAQEQKLLSEDNILMIAVSGGVDSVVLARICHGLKYNIVIAHCNFQLRGADSGGDELFVQKMAEQLNVPFYAKKFNTKAFKETAKIGTQEAARNLRYAFFDELAVELETASGKKVSLLTAHHLDDNVETCLMYFFRGTGIRGLLGMHTKENRLQRPLLFATKIEIEAYAAENDIVYRKDLSNEGTEYKRNLLRNKLIPVLTEAFPQLQHAVSKNIGLFKDVFDIYQEAILNKQKLLARRKGSSVKMLVSQLQKMLGGRACLHEIIRPFNFTAAQENDVWNLCFGETGKMVSSATHRIIRDRDFLVILPIQKPDPSAYSLVEGSAEFSFDAGSLQLHFLAEPGINADENIAELDADLVAFPLTLRKWKYGDYFYPLGMRKKKPLNRFFIDQKYAVDQKENIWIVESGQKIIWVVGCRIDDRFKITGKTKNVLRIAYALPAE